MESIKLVPMWVTTGDESEILEGVGFETFIGIAGENKQCALFRENGTIGFQIIDNPNYHYCHREAVSFLEFVLGCSIALCENEITNQTILAQNLRTKLKNLINQNNEKTS